MRTRGALLSLLFSLGLACASVPAHAEPSHGPELRPASSPTVPLEPSSPTAAARALGPFVLDVIPARVFAASVAPQSVSISTPERVPESAHARRIERPPILLARSC